MHKLTGHLWQIKSSRTLTSIWWGLIMSTTGIPPVCVRQQTRPGCCGTSLHWHKAADWEFLLPPELFLKVTGNIFFNSFWSLLHGATNVFPVEINRNICFRDCKASSEFITHWLTALSITHLLINQKLQAEEWHRWKVKHWNLFTKEWKPKMIWTMMYNKIWQSIY